MREAETILGIIRERGRHLRHRSLESRLEIERLTSGSEGGCWKSADEVTRWQPTLRAPWYARSELPPEVAEVQGR
jgi:hypothetical protein